MQHWRIIKTVIIVIIFNLTFVGSFWGIDLLFQALGMGIAEYWTVTHYIAAAICGVLAVYIANQLGWQVYSGIKERIITLSLADFTIGIISLIIGLIMGALASVPLAGLPDPWSWISSIVVAITSSVTAIWAFNLKKATLLEWSGTFQKNLHTSSAHNHDDSHSEQQAPELVNPMVLDTSAIIDGRIREVIKSGFLYGTLIIPSFVLQELQFVADSNQPEKRQRGRAGLKILQGLRRNKNISVKTLKTDYPEIKEVDTKIVRLAQELNAKIITCDYNLNAVAKVNGIRILNVNELANYLKQVYLPGEVVSIKILQAGREDGQGVGFLTDGTMVVVQGGAKHIDKELKVSVDKVLQTDAGRMIFGKIASNPRTS